MEFFQTRAETLGFDQMRLILPAVSTGNVGQLAVDLLIATLSMPLIGYLQCPYVLPAAGYNAYGADDTLHLALEVYADAAHNLVVMQQRAPTLRGCQQQFAAAVVEWMQKCNFQQVIQLASLNVRTRKDGQMTGSQLGYIATDEQAQQVGSEIGIRQLEQEDDEQTSQLLSPWPLIKAAASSAQSMLTVVTFASEGENIADADSLCMGMSQYLLGEMKDSTAWQHPLSWQTVYGRPQDAVAF